MRDATPLLDWWTLAAEAAASTPVQMIALCGGVALVSAALLTPLVIRLAWRNDWVALPSEDRWHEHRVVALMGGSAIFAAAALAVLFTGAAAALTWPVGAAAALLFTVGVADDAYGLSPSAKLLAQVAAAVLTIYGGLLFWESGPFWLSAPLTFLWVIGITNAFNLIDGMDGLAAGIAAIAACALAVIAAHLGLPGAAGVAAAVAGASGGFLLFNAYPARIFMGDGGSLFLGYALAAAAVIVQNGGDGAARPGAVLVPAVVLAVPIFDVVLVTVMRVAHGRSITQGGTDHSMHRLVFLGLSERQTVFFLYGISAGLGALALLLYTNAALLFGALVLASAAALVVLGSHIGGADVYAQDGEAKRGVADDPERNGRKETPRSEKVPAGERPRTFSETFGAVMQALVGRYWKRAGGLLADTLAVLAAFVMAHALRFPGGMPELYQSVMLQALPLVAGGKVAVFYAMGVYRRLWSRAGTPEMVYLVKAVLLTSGLTFVGMHVAYSGDAVSASALFVDMLLTGVSIGATRFGFRALRQYIVYMQRTGQKVLICGADAEGILAMRILNCSALSLHVAGFIDRDERSHGRHVKGVPVVGGLEKMEEICEREGVSGVVVNTTTYAGAEIERISRRCWTRGLNCYRVDIGLDMLTNEGTMQERKAFDRGTFESVRGSGADAEQESVLVPLRTRG